MTQPWHEPVPQAMAVSRLYQLLTPSTAEHADHTAWAMASGPHTATLSPGSNSDESAAVTNPGVPMLPSSVVVTQRQFTPVPRRSATSSSTGAAASACPASRKPSSTRTS